MKRVILDMDPGVDDALAIILAILSPELMVEAITTVGGNTNVDLCTRNVRRILEILRPKVPPIVARGEAGALVTATEVHGRDGLGNLDRFTGNDGTTMRYPEPLLYPVSSHHAVDVILSLITENPYEITLIPTGPLTNIARAIIQNPEGMKKLKEIIIMGGAFNVPGNVTAVAEFNIYADPYAADVIVNSGLPITFVGLDVTHQVWLGKSRMEVEIKPLNTRLSQFICDISGVYMDFHKEYYGISGCHIHDLLAVGVAIGPGFVETEDIYVQVETQGKITSGMTVADLRPARLRDSEPNVRICVNVDADRFLTLFLNAIKKWQDVG